ncbi:MAG: AAA family ATPase [Lachnospiraceae bacterium]|nr:AAA family ATPase [Lachnospiraceae bacterium]
MNIQQAKDYIKDSVRIYLKKDELGEYRIPLPSQRPIFLLGAPGIGKTAIMEQIASELGIALVSYSMTHHTRQSALGLPYIVEKEYEGESFSVSEYTMSEIIASVYETMEKSGIREGILFLDEINCVSETLSPSMLQFLQYKTFGRHRVPEGWIIVTAGNPPEYNRSVREFDVVTLDRLKILEVEEDYPTWKRYAAEKGVHPAVQSFLELKKEFFYHIETTVKGRLYVTARGWEDLSRILLLYEEEGLTVDETLVGQYIRSPQIVKEFAAYYDLYCKYRKDYHVDEILKGNIDEKTAEKAGQAPFDERLALTGMLVDVTINDMRECMAQADYLKELIRILQPVKEAGDPPKDAVGLAYQQTKKKMESLKNAGALDEREQRKFKKILRFLERTGGFASFDDIRELFDEQTDALKKHVAHTGTQTENVFGFIADAFDQGNEMLILVTELTASRDAARYIASFGCPSYTEYNKQLMIYQRSGKIADKIAALGDLTL